MTCSMIVGWAWMDFAAACFGDKVMGFARLWIFTIVVISVVLVITAWLERYGHLGERVLAVADSNVAVDDLLLPYLIWTILSFYLLVVGTWAPESAAFNMRA